MAVGSGVASASTSTSTLHILVHLRMDEVAWMADLGLGCNHSDSEHTHPSAIDHAAVPVVSFPLLSLLFPALAPPSSSCCVVSAAVSVPPRWMPAPHTRSSRHIPHVTTPKNVVPGHCGSHTNLDESLQGWDGREAMMLDSVVEMSIRSVNDGGVTRKMVEERS